MSTRKDDHAFQMNRREAIKLGAAVSAAGLVGAVAGPVSAKTSEGSTCKGPLPEGSPAGLSKCTSPA